MSQAIIDVIVPKFVQADLPLAIAIFGDLFLGVVVPQTDYSVLMQGVAAATKTANLQMTPELCTKISQL